MYRLIKPTIVAASLVAIGIPSAQALEGFVHDENGKPIQGARVCYLVPGDASGLCAETGETGFYRLPDSRISHMRVMADGYLPRKIQAIPRERPIRLARAAVILVRLRDASTGEPIAGEVGLVTTFGSRKGPFPASEGGVRVRTLPPGPVKLNGRAEGYREKDGHPAKLIAGEEVEVVVDLEPIR